MDNIINYWNKQPCNIKHSRKEIGTLEYFEEVSSRKYFVEPHILEFVDFNKWKGLKVLEVGCGIGTAAISFIQAGAIYTGIDISDVSIEIAKKRLDIYKIEGVLLVDNIETFETSEKYDLIYSFGVLHHTLNIKKAITNIKNLLKDDGTFKLMLYAKNSWKQFKIEDGLDQYEAQANVPIANVYTNDDIMELLKDFNNINILQTHIFPYKIKEYKEYKYEKEDYFKVMPDELFKCLEKHLGFHLCITCNK
jgi:SAM-dependent methyltransferase